MKDDDALGFSVLLYDADHSRLYDTDADSSHETLEEAIEQAKQSLADDDDAQSVEVFDEQRRQAVFNKDKEEDEADDE